MVSTWEDSQTVLIPFAAGQGWFIKQDHRNAVQIALDKIRGLNENNAKLQNLAQSANEERDRVRESFMVNSSDKDRLENRIKDLENKLNMSTQANLKLGNEVEHLKNQIEGQAVYSDKLREQMETTLKENKRLKDQVNENQDAIQALLKEVSDSKEEYDIQGKRLLEEIKRQQDERETIQDSIKIVSEESDKQKKINNDLWKKNNVLVNGIHNLYDLTKN